MFKKTLIAAVLTVAATGSFAQIYVEGNFGKGNINVDCAGLTQCDKSSSGSKFVAGYEINKDWSAEVLITNFGKANLAISLVQFSEEAKATGVGFGAAYKGEINKDWFYKLGIGLSQNKIKEELSTGTSSSTSNTALIYGLSAGYNINQSVSLIGGLDFSSVKSSAGGNDGSVSLLSVGVRYKF